MITKLSCRYSFEVLDFNCNGFGFTFNIGVPYLGIFYKTSMILTQCYTGSKVLIDGRPRTNFSRYFYETSMDTVCFFLLVPLVRIGIRGRGKIGTIDKSFLLHVMCKFHEITLVKINDSQ